LKTSKNKSLESEVIEILTSSENIVKAIKSSYKKQYENVIRHPSVRKEQMPIFLAFLYDYIIQKKKLPSNVEFIEDYMRTYYSDISKETMIYFAYVYRVHQSYESLIRDLHFYFKLKESGYFDNVTISYAYDIEAKQDIVVTLGNKKLGLQLFSGTDANIPLKRRQTTRRRVDLGYDDYYLPLNGSKACPENIGCIDNPFYAYSDKDVKLIFKELTAQKELKSDTSFEPYVYPSEVHNKSNYSLEKVKKEIADTRHSFVYIGKERIEDNLNMVENLTKCGVKVEWISSTSNSKTFNNMIRLHSWANASRYNLKISDGNFSDKEKNLLERIGEDTTFNFEQYAIEHSGLDKHLMVEAGAGSGKTETLISRIIYLLHLRKVITLEEIVMITFTNEAADNMKLKLSNRLFYLFEITGDVRYIDWNEQVTNMRIMTIPSFSKTLLQDFSQELGMSRNFAVRSLKVERKELIEDILDEYIQNNSLGYKDLGEIRDYEIVKMVDNFWGQLEQKGIVIDNYNDVKWGNPPKDKTEGNYFKLFQNVLKSCEERFSREKLIQDVFTVNDLTQKISSIKPYLNKNQLSTPFKFLFIDEFQDTDDIQIELVKTLAEITKAHLFIVGDIKQSIYRFRGANYTAFDLLSKGVGDDSVNREFKLRKNYRTASGILNPLENIFDVWRNHSRKLLPNSKEDNKNKENRLIPTIHLKKYKKPFKLSTDIDDIGKEILKLYQSLELDEKQIKEKKPVELAVLVRTNLQAKEIRKTLDDLRKSLPSITYEMVIGGSLFSSDAARDLLILLKSLSYEEDIESFFALSQTPFSTKSFNPSEWISMEGDAEKLKLKMTENEVKGFSIAKQELRIKPTLHVIYQFLTTNPFEQVLKAMSNQNHEIQKYRLNLFRVLELAGNSIESSMLTINKLRDWLEQQVAVNRDEDEMEVDITDCNEVIKVMTIHKAKGLEFDSVFIPYTSQAIIKKSTQDMIVVKEDDIIHAGWKASIGPKNNKYEALSPNFNDLKEIEDDESLREEARLLYVAMTRAKHRLVVKCVEPKYEVNKLYNWSELIRLREGGKY
jgi:superfamily I DNA/RNA helicase